MKKLILMTSILLFSFNNTHARKAFFGKVEDINKIQNLNVKGPNGEDLYLAYKTEMFFLGLGLYFKDQGYVLGVDGKYGSYYALDDNKIKDLQEVNQLPTPLPSYNISWKDYALGYSAWLVILLFIIRIILYARKSNK